MRILISVLLLLIAFFVFAFVSKKKPFSQNNPGKQNDQGIQFIEANWNKAIEEAKKQHKLIFLDAYASWCGPCRLLKRKTFPEKIAGDFFNKNFINVAIDMEQGDGPALSSKYGVNAYPTLIITDADGNIITYTQGYIEPKELVAFGEHGLKESKR